MNNLEEIEALHVVRVAMDEIFNYIPGDFFITGSRVIDGIHCFLNKQSIFGIHEKVDFDIFPIDNDNELQIIDFLKKESHHFNKKKCSYYFNVGDRIFNVISLDGDSPQDILSRFDMVHCAISIGRNNCLVMEDSFHYIKHRTINFNYLSNMWKTIGRIVKYCNRGFCVPEYAIRNFQDHCLEFSKKFKKYSWTNENDLEHNYNWKDGISLQNRNIIKFDYNTEMLNLIRDSSKEKNCFIEI